MMPLFAGQASPTRCGMLGSVSRQPYQKWQWLGNLTSATGGKRGVNTIRGYVLEYCEYQVQERKF